jgi:hypothetical protein
LIAFLRQNKDIKDILVTDPEKCLQQQQEFLEQSAILEREEQE